MKVNEVLTRPETLKFSLFLACLLAMAFVLSRSIESLENGQEVKFKIDFMGHRVVDVEIGQEESSLGYVKEIAELRTKLSICQEEDVYCDLDCLIRPEFIDMFSNIRSQHRGSD